MTTPLARTWTPQPEASKDDLFVAEIIAELEMEQNNKTTFDFEYVPECMLDDMPGLIPCTTVGTKSYHCFTMSLQCLSMMMIPFATPALYKRCH